MRTLWVIALLLAAPYPLLARGGGGCLERGTFVSTPFGEVAVEQLRPGDAVLSFGRGGAMTAQVQAVTQIAPGDYCELSIDGHTLRLTGTHPIETEPGVFRTAEVLKKGDKVCVRDRGAFRPATVDSVGRIRSASPAFNLLVAPGGTYVAGGVLVHNKGCFLPDTLIRREDGTEVRISCIQARDRVLAFTPGGEVVSATVRRVLTHEVDEYCVVRTKGMDLHVTAEHPFYVGAGTF